MGVSQRYFGVLWKFRLGCSRGGGGWADGIVRCVRRVSAGAAGWRKMQYSEGWAACGGGRLLGWRFLGRSGRWASLFEAKGFRGPDLVDDGRRLSLDWQVEGLESLIV